MKDQNEHSAIVLQNAGLPGLPGSHDVTLQEGRIAALQPATGPARRILLPLMADLHVHLDKTDTVARTGAGATSLMDAITRMDADKPNWSAEDLHARASAALERAWLHGVAVMRSHVDWLSAEPPPAWEVLRQLQNDWHGRVDLQLSTLTPLDLMPEIGAEIATHVAEDGGVFGAFVYRNDDLEAKLAHVFALADRHGLSLDFHVDEGLDPLARGIDTIVAEALARPDGPRVLCGHGCALSVRPEDEVNRVLDQAAEAGVGLTVLPTTNCYLQDNTPGRTPRMRGIAPLKEARAAGVEVLIASDNVRDVFYPYGDYDLFAVFRDAVLLGHLNPGEWLDAITRQPAHWAGSTLPDLTQGAAASFIEIAVSDLDSALALPAATRTVWRDGHTLTGWKEALAI